MTERSMDQAVKQAESRQLLRSAVPLIAAGVVTAPYGTPKLVKFPVRDRKVAPAAYP